MSLGIVGCWDTPERKNAAARIESRISADAELEAVIVDPVAEADEFEKTVILDLWHR